MIQCNTEVINSNISQYPRSLYNNIAIHNIVIPIQQNTQYRYTNIAQYTISLCQYIVIARYRNTDVSCSYALTNHYGPVIANTSMQTHEKIDWYNDILYFDILELIILVMPCIVNPLITFVFYIVHSKAKLDRRQPGQMG